LQILRIEPFEFCAVEHGIGPAHAFERKARDDFGCAQELGVLAGRPSEQRKKIPECFRQESLVAVGTHAGGAVALREPRAVRAEDQRHVREDGRRGA